MVAHFVYITGTALCGKNTHKYIVESFHMMSSENLQSLDGNNDTIATVTPESNITRSGSSNNNSISPPTSVTEIQQPIVSSVLPPNLDKVKIHFVAVGSAPILKRTKFQINADQRFAAVHVFLHKLLKLSPSTTTTSDQNNSNSSNNNTSGSSSSTQNLFLYCYSAFVPSPDHLVGELRDSFATRDELVIHYSIQEAWG
jgi:ubiquitin-like protein ATG12